MSKTHPILDKLKTLGILTVYNCCSGVPIFFKKILIKDIDMETLSYNPNTNIITLCYTENNATYRISIVDTDISIGFILEYQLKENNKIKLFSVIKYNCPIPKIKIQ